MKIAFTIFLVFWVSQGSAQESEKEAVKKTIETFFEGFHRQDSLMIRQTVDQNIILQTIGNDSLGNVIVHTEVFSDFLKSIVSIPDSTLFQEVIKSFSIQVDGPMANAWTPYDFMLNGSFHHCGVNSFQLVKDHEQWNIIYLIDTRRKDGCE
ncbi:MAG: nuclear transport factor 2 family protein [Flavobacteriales bacterium]|nr:MAG: nuclear transport factor 2 family protein [Flavobacteriales bacterium]